MLECAMPAPVKRNPNPSGAAAKPYHHGISGGSGRRGAALFRRAGPSRSACARPPRAGAYRRARRSAFSDRVALMTVAEEAQRRFRAEISGAQRGARGRSAGAISRFRAGFICAGRCAIRRIRDHLGREILRHDKASELSRDSIGDRHGRALADAFAGPAPFVDLKQVQIAGRALVYGFARMNIDGHFPRWGIADVEAGRIAEAILDLFIEGIARRPGPA